MQAFEKTGLKKFLSYILSFSIVLSMTYLPVDVAYAGKVSILVIPYQAIHAKAPQEALVEATDALYDEVKSVKNFKLIKPQLKKIKSNKGENKKNLAEEKFNQALELCDMGKKDLLKSDFSSALNKFKRAFTLFENSMHYRNKIDRAVECIAILASTYYRLGNDAKGQDIIDKVVALNPDFQLNGSIFPAAFIRIYEKRRSALLHSSKGSIQITTIPSGAQLYVDGKKRGTTPLLVKDLIPGNHYILVEKENFDSSGTVARVRANRTEKIELELGGGVKLMGDEGVVASHVVRNRINYKTKMALKRLAHKYGASYIIFGGIYKEKNGYVVATLLYSSARRKLVRLVQGNLDLELFGVAEEIYNIGRDLEKKVKSFKPMLSGAVIRVYNKFKEQNKIKAVSAAATTPAERKLNIPQPQTTSHYSAPATPATGPVPSTPAPAAPIPTTPKAATPSPSIGPAVPVAPAKPAPKMVEKPKKKKPAYISLYKREAMKRQKLQNQKKGPITKPAPSVPPAVGRPDLFKAPAAPKTPKRPSYTPAPAPVQKTITPQPQTNAATPSVSPAPAATQLPPPPPDIELPPPPPLETNNTKTTQPPVVNPAASQPTEGGVKRIIIKRGGKSQVLIIKKRGTVTTSTSGPKATSYPSQQPGMNYGQYPNRVQQGQYQAYNQQTSASQPYLQRQPIEEAVPIEEQKRSKPFYSTSLFWIIAGSVVLAAGVTAGVVLMLSGSKIEKGELDVTW